MKIRSVVSSEESCDEMEAATLNQASPAAEKVQWTWKREALQMKKTNIIPYNRRVIIEDITEELKLIGEGVYQKFLNSCFGSLMRFDTQRANCCTALHWLFAHEVVKADAGPDELWYRVGGRFIRFSKHEYALVTGLSFGPTSFDPSAEHHPPASGLFSRHYQGQRLKMDTLRHDFTAGLFRKSPADALKVAKLLFVYFLLFGLNGRITYIDDWAWTLIEDNDGWETFIWGNYSYQILLTHLQQLPTVLPPFGTPTYHIYGFVSAFWIWAFEAIPALRIACGVHATNDELPRCLRWRFPKRNQVVMEGLCNRQLEVYSMLEPNAKEQRQPYWEHITDDLRSDVCYTQQNNMKNKKTTVSRPRRFKAIYSKKKRKGTDPLTTCTLRSCHTSAAPMIGKRKRTDPLTTLGSPDLSEHECDRQDEMTSIIQQEFFSQKNSLSPRHTPDNLPVGGVSSSGWIDRPGIQSKCLQNPAIVFRRRHEVNINSKPELSNVAVGQAGRNTSIINLMETINELKNKNMENERLMGVHEEKCKCLDIKMVRMSQEMEELRQEKLEAGQVVKKLKHENLNANKIIDELRLKKSESDKLVEVYKSKLDAVRELASWDDAENVVNKSSGSKNSGLSKKDAHASIGTRLMSGEGCFSKIARSSSTATGDKTEILDSDDDESLSDSRMNDIIASLRSEKIGKKWMYEVDMLRAFQHSEEICMNAVCVLYRQQTQLKGRSINRGFSPVNSMSGCTLSEYLIDGDVELRLRKSVWEVKKERPDVIAQCRKLATTYVDKLFAIYCAADDPFFGKS